MSSPPMLGGHCVCKRALAFWFLRGRSPTGRSLWGGFFVVLSPREILVEPNNPRKNDVELFRKDPQLLAAGVGSGERRRWCEHHTSHVAFSHWIIRTWVAQVVSWACAHHIPCIISLRLCCVFDSLRLLHFPLFAVYLLSCCPVFPPGHQLHLPRCGGQSPCAIQLMRTLAPLPRAALSQK